QGGVAWPWLSWPGLLTFMAAAMFLLATVFVELRAAEPILPGWLFRDKALSGINVAMVGLGIVTMAPMAYLPIYAQSVYGLGAVAAGLVLASMSIGWPTASALSGQLYLRIGFRDTALLGSVLIVLAGIAFLLL